MLAESNWWSIRSQFQKTLPSSVSVSYLKSLLNLKSDQSARNIISPLRQMGIIDDDGKPTSRANEWRNDEKYADVCKAIVDEVYPSDLADLFPEVPIDIGRARSWFMDTGRVGESAAAKITATYALLRTAKVNPDAASSKPIKRPQSMCKARMKRIYLSRLLISPRFRPQIRAYTLICKSTSHQKHPWNKLTASLPA